MKQMKTLALAIALILGMSGIAQAQDSKIAHIATQELLEQMPAFKLPKQKCKNSNFL